MAQLLPKDRAMNQTILLQQPFFGWRIVAGAFILATFGWGLGFYGPPIYLHAVREARGWSVALVSAAVTTHYLLGALVVANLPALYRRFGLPAITRTGSVALALGLVGWASAVEPWQLFLATVLTGCGWVTMGAAAINAIVSPWFFRLRPKALSTAYNGASIGGVVFSPLWVLLIGAVGFQTAATIIGAITVAVVWWLTAVVFRYAPADLGQLADGDATSGPSAAAAMNAIPALPGAALWRSWKFRTLAAGMALGLFAQIGLLAHLFSLIVPALGASWAGVVMGLATASAIAGRTAFGWLMPVGADRRKVAALSYGIQIVGAAALILSGLQTSWLIILGILLFGFGIGNATSLPPLIAQAEFAKVDTPRVVALIVAMGQATYAFAPLVFGLLRDGVAGGAIASAAVFIMAMVIKLAAIAVFLAGRGPRMTGA
jgi:Major Facilitator Superfamily